MRNTLSFPLFSFACIYPKYLERNIVCVSSSNNWQKKIEKYVNEEKTQITKIYILFSNGPLCQLGIELP